ncbi:ER-derived vesicles protein ERV29 [Coprinopsis cinerea okayama7|uniref:ER-derived vesicles protein ERV29 n=1 Tax=Coprinopsis cinerea (strain Okayama-7 / 130 / ATCC MYA-4618 / FGSC 9003) TaxID=240176 RepID=A8PCE5_COPC7|nr:ER-derived vesicles protein ERV29 [Coprinopsis cinerea okayama7\|eukprot:XP_001840377.1 ER-derived vesicles protein ERV29 [Coprinopsis cinerea okayama7\
MSSRYSGYQQNNAYGGFNPNASGPGYRAVNDYSSSGAQRPLEKLQAFSKSVEDSVDRYSTPLRPYLPVIGRFLIVSTFLEDALRMMVQRAGQNLYLQTHRHFPWGVSHLFLLVNILTMTAGSAIIITKRPGLTEYSVFGLLAVVVIQGLGYGLIFDFDFFLRSLSVIGGLFMVFSDSMVNPSGRGGFAGLPSITETDRRKYFLLAGRVLLIFLFLGFIIRGQWTFGRILLSIIGLAACAMVAVGFKAKWSAAFLVLVLSSFNVFANNWWAVDEEDVQRDFLKYDFFQTLSIVGGLILLVNIGPGGISVDENKKNF